MSTTSQKKSSSVRRPRPPRRAATEPATADRVRENVDVVTTTAGAVTAPAVETDTVPMAAIPAAAPADQVAQLAFSYFAESGFLHGHALDHWLRAENELKSGT